MVDGARKGKDALRDLGDQANRTSDTFNGLNSKTNLLTAAFRGLIALGVAKFFRDIITASGGFETKMAEISTLVDTAVFKIGMLEDALKKQSVAFGQDASAQAAAAYQIISAGAGSATEAITTLDAANRLAIGGVTDVATAADGLTSVLNAYGDKVDGATAVSDALFVGMRAGKTTIGELSSSLGKVAPLAAATGVSFDELVAAVAALTKGGISTQESVTGVRAILAAVVKPTKEASDLAKQLGIDFSAAGLESKGFAGFMAELVQKTGGSSDALAQLFGGVEALVPAMALAGQAGVDFTAIMEDMENKGGSTAEAFEKMSNTFEFQAARVRQGLNVALIELGDIITSALTPVLRVLADNFDVISRFIKVAAVGLTALMIPAILALIPAIATATAGLIAMAAAWVLTPFGAIQAIIIAIAAAVAYFGDTTVTVAGNQVKLWTAITTAVSVAWDLIKEGAAIISSVFSTGSDVMAGFFGKVGGWLGDWVGDWSGAIGAVGEWIKDAVNVWIGLHVGFVKAIGPVIQNGIPALFALAMGAAKNAVLTALQGIINAFVKGLGALGDALDYIPGIDGLGEKIRGALTVDFSDLKSDTEALKNDFAAAGEVISGTFGEALSTDYVGRFGDAVSAVGDTLGDRFTAKLAEANGELETANKSSTTLAGTTTTTVIPALDGLGGSASKAAGSMKDLNKEREDFIKSIDDEFAKIQEAQGGAVAIVEQWYSEQKAKLQSLGLAYTEYADKLEAIFNERLAEAYKKDLDNATDWRSGIERAVANLGESIGTEADLAETALTSIFDNAANAIANFAKTGKLDFKEFARSVAADILMLTTKMLLLQALKSVFPGLADGGKVGGFANGGMVKLAGGGGPVVGPGGPRTDSIPAMLSNGEFVVNANATKDFLPMLEAINSGNMSMMGLAAGGLSNDSSTLPAQPQAAPQPAQDNSTGKGEGGGGNNITIIPTLNPSDIVDTFDSDDGDRVLVNMLQRNATTIRGILS